MFRQQSEWLVQKSEQRRIDVALLPGSVDVFTFVHGPGGMIKVGKIPSLASGNADQGIGKQVGQQQGPTYCNRKAFDLYHYWLAHSTSPCPSHESSLLASMAVPFCGDPTNGDYWQISCEPVSDGGKLAVFSFPLLFLTSPISF